MKVNWQLFWTLLSLDRETLTVKNLERRKDAALEIKNYNSLKL